MNRTIIVILCFVLASCANGQQKKVPGPQGYINDFAHLLTAEQKNSLDSLVRSFEKETTVEIALLTMDSSSVPAEKFDSLVTATHNSWGVGKKEKNNGMLIALCMDIRRVRISTGRGLEKQLTDAEAQRIVNEDMLPLYKLGEIYEGTRKGIIAIMQELR